MKLKSSIGQGQTSPLERGYVRRNTQRVLEPNEGCVRKHSSKSHQKHNLKLKKKMRRPIIPYHPHLVEKARFLRKNSTKSEILLWKYLKGKQMYGFDFHRQRPVDRYIIDFFCCELYLGIELDGYSHFTEEASRRDLVRQECLSDLGVQLLRFDDREVFRNLDSVLCTIENTVLQLKPKG
ncbi:MAG TPA: endonuclease domain-containing protein [Balneolaceae bacterium]|nr:endonuclease domain-containing protein [Balneolaceae bacterium]